MSASPGLSRFATATSWALSPPRPTGVSNTSVRSQTSSPGGPPSTCWRTRAAHSTQFACSSHQLSFLAAAESFAGVPTKEGNTRAKCSSSNAWKWASPRNLWPPTRLRKMACPSALVGRFAVWFAAFLSTVDSRPSCGGSSCSLRLTSATVCHSGLTWRHRSSGYTAREAICRISRSSALKLSSTPRVLKSWNPSPGKERCAASARTKRPPTGLGNRKLAGWWRAGT